MHQFYKNAKRYLKLLHFEHIDCLMRGEMVNLQKVWLLKSQPKHKMTFWFVDSLGVGRFSYIGCFTAICMVCGYYYIYVPRF